MKNSHFENGPVVIGGVGGSGTRVVAEILSTFNYFIGNDLNNANDNLLYTFLFKRPRWLYRNRENKRAIGRGFGLFHKIMTGKSSLPFLEMIFLLRSASSMAIFGHNYNGTGRGLQPLKLLKKCFFAKKHYNYSHAGWGWKEPNTFLLIQDMAEHFENFKYIHTIRHGLDMAFSKNQQQLYNWGPLYGVERPSIFAEEPKASLKYWVRANEKVLQEGKAMGDDKFLLVPFEELCLSPEVVIDRIISFLDVAVDKDSYQRAINLPRKPASVGRYRSHDLGQFDAEDLASLQKLGFSI
jgi:hypothetical protein